MAAIRWGLVAVAFGLAIGPALASTQGSALVADDGRKVMFGDGSEYAIRIHDAHGRMVRERQLADFLPAAYVHALPRGEHGVQWRREAKFADGQDSVEFSVAAPGSTAGATGPGLTFSIDLRDGSVRTAQIREYLAAAGEARALEARLAQR